MTMHLPDPALPPGIPAAKPRPPCRRCGKPATRPRGLCWSCYHSPARDAFPSTSKFARRGVADRVGDPPLPAEPTGALPGSEEKLRVLEARAAARVRLWHPQDFTGGRQQGKVRGFHHTR